MQNFIHDLDYIECGLTIQNTVHLASIARRLLPVVAPTPGLTSKDWGSQFFYAKAKFILRGWPDTPFMAARCLEEGAGKNRS